METLCFFGKKFQKDTKIDEISHKAEGVVETRLQPQSKTVYSNEKAQG